MKVYWEIAWRALGRNRLQTALTMIGMTVGVATVVAMMAVGAGAQQSIEQQVRAAGLNAITIRAGNWKPKAEESGEAVAHQARLEDAGGLPGRLKPAPTYGGRSVDAGRLKPAPAYGGRSVDAGRLKPAPTYGGRSVDAGRLKPAPAYDGDETVVGAGFSRPDLDVVRPASFHPEDDPMEKHDHPTARQRLGDLEAGLGSAATLVLADAEAIRREVPGVQYVAVGIHENAHVASGDKRWFTRMHGTDMDLPLIRRAWAFPRGRFFTAREQGDAAQVMVLGTVVAARLFGEDADPVGRTVTMWNQSFEVVGVLGSTSWVVQPAAGDDQFDAVYVPFTTVHRLLNLTKLNDITVTAASSGEVTQVSAAIINLLRTRHRIGPNQPDDFTLSTQARQALATGGLPPTVARAVAGNVAELEKVTLEQLAQTLEQASRTMTALLAAVAFVSLLVGGIGIMNITLLSVTERTREIGLRMAVGARSTDVLWQFLTEAVAISLIGGAAGIAIGVGVAFGIARSLRWATVVSPSAVALAFGIAAMIGVAFGFWPARRAAHLDPIVALRRD